MPTQFVRANLGATREGWSSTTTVQADAFTTEFRVPFPLRPAAIQLALNPTHQRVSPAAVAGIFGGSVARLARKLFAAPASLFKQTRIESPAMCSSHKRFVQANLSGPADFRRSLNPQFYTSMSDLGLYHQRSRENQRRPIGSRMPLVYRLAPIPQPQPPSYSQTHSPSPVIDGFASAP